MTRLTPSVVKHEDVISADVKYYEQTKNVENSKISVITDNSVHYISDEETGDDA